MIELRFATKHRDIRIEEGPIINKNFLIASDNIAATVGSAQGERQGKLKIGLNKVMFGTAAGHAQNNSVDVLMPLGRGFFEREKLFGRHRSDEQRRIEALVWRDRIGRKGRPIPNQGFHK